MNLEEDRRWMMRALYLAEQGQGFVEPNPMVGCVIVCDGEVLGEGWHQRFGEPHAERNAYSAVTDHEKLVGATWYVTLEPCCHHGKTPPCTDLLLQCKPQRVVVALTDPFAKVAGEGIRRLQDAKVIVDVGNCVKEATRLNAPYLKRLRTGLPWVIGKWAMTLDGKIASRTGDSQWISGEESRQRVHQLRGRMDAIMVGVGTALADNPLLTARPAGPRAATRVIFDRTARLPLTSNLVNTARDIPVLVVCDHSADNLRAANLQRAGVEVLVIEATSSIDQTIQLLRELGRRSFTNVLVEGGSGLMASLLEAGALDEFVVFVAPKLLGGKEAATPVAGLGLEKLTDSPRCEPLHVEILGEDVLITTRVE